MSTGCQNCSRLEREAPRFVGLIVGLIPGLGARAGDAAEWLTGVLVRWVTTDSIEDIERVTLPDDMGVVTRMIRELRVTQPPPDTGDDP